VTVQVALFPEARTDGLHTRPVIPKVLPADIVLPVGGPPEEITGGGVPEVLGGGELPPEVTGGELPPEGLGAGWGFPVEVLGGGGITGVPTEIVPATPTTDTGFPAGKTLTGLAIPTGTLLAADDDNVALIKATIPPWIVVVFKPVTRHVYVPLSPAHWSVLFAAIAAGPAVALIATTFAGL